MVPFGNVEIDGPAFGTFTGNYEAGYTFNHLTIYACKELAIINETH